MEGKRGHSRLLPPAALGRAEGLGGGERLSLCPAGGFEPLPQPAGGGSRSLLAVATSGEAGDIGAEGRFAAEVREGQGLPWRRAPAGSKLPR